MMTTNRYNYYEILEVSSNAAQHEVTTAYERARNTYSGDNPAIYTIFSEHEARELLNLIEEAYAVLGNKTLRTIYDQRLLGSKSPVKELNYESILNASKAMLPEIKTHGPAKPEYKQNEEFERQIKEATDWDGALLKKVREYKCISVERMSERTKINTWYLNAIETMDAANLPALVFVRGYVIQICRQLELNEKIVADSYMKLFKTKVK
jgi:curved DNA-binding protein CbpA